MKINLPIEFENDKVFSKFDLDNDGFLLEEEVQLAILYKYGLEIENSNLKRLYYTNICKVYINNEFLEDKIRCNYEEFCELAYLIERSFVLNNLDKVIIDYVDSFDTETNNINNSNNNNEINYKKTKSNIISFDEYYSEIIKILPHVSSITIANTYSYLSQSENKTEKAITVESLKNKASEIFFT